MPTLAPLGGGWVTAPGYFLNIFFLTFFLQYVSLYVMKHTDAIRRRQQLASSLPPLTEIVRGSLLERTIRHKRGCPKCARGGGHPVLVLTIGYAGGVTKQYSLRPEMKAQVRQWLKNYHQLKAKLEAICEVNHTLLRPEK